MVFVNLLGGRVEREGGGERKSATLMIISKSFFTQNFFFNFHSLVTRPVKTNACGRPYLM